MNLFCYLNLVKIQSFLPFPLKGVLCCRILISKQQIRVVLRRKLILCLGLLVPASYQCNWIAKQSRFLVKAHQVPLLIMGILVFSGTFFFFSDTYPCLKVIVSRLILASHAFPPTCSFPLVFIKHQAQFRFSLIKLEASILLGFCFCFYLLKQLSCLVISGLLKKARAMQGQQVQVLDQKLLVSNTKWSLQIQRMKT